MARIAIGTKTPKELDFFTVDPPLLKELPGYNSDQKQCLRPTPKGIIVRLQRIRVKNGKGDLLHLPWIADSIGAGPVNMVRIAP